MQSEIHISEATTLLKSLETGSVKLLISDPPYGIGYHSNHYKDKNPHAPIAHDWNFQVGPFLDEVGRVLSDGGAMYLFCRYDVLPLWMPSIPPAEMKEKTIIAWVKDNWSAGDLEGSFGNQYESIIFATKGRHLLRGKRWPNVWEFPRVPAKSLLHPAQKPTALLKRAIESSSDPGDIVVDPFCGSGSTGEAANQTGRGFLMCDIDNKMVRMAKIRLKMSVEQEDEIRPPAALEFAPESAESWGLHPEDMKTLYDEITGNIEHNGKQLTFLNT